MSEESRKTLSEEIEERIAVLEAYPIAQDWSHHPRAKELRDILPKVKALEVELEIADEEATKALLGHD